MPGPETETTREINGHDFRKAIDDLFSVRHGKQGVETTTYYDWDAKDHVTAPIWQELPLLERPFNPDEDADLDSVPGFTIERWIYFPEPGNYTFDYYFIVDGVRHTLYFNDDGSVEDSYEILAPEVSLPSNHGIFPHLDKLSPDEVAEWHRKLTSPDLTPDVTIKDKAQEIPGTADFEQPIGPQPEYLDREEYPNRSSDTKWLTQKEDETREQFEERVYGRVLTADELEEKVVRLEEIFRGANYEEEHTSKVLKRSRDIRDARRQREAESE